MFNVESKPHPQWARALTRCRDYLLTTTTRTNNGKTLLTITYNWSMKSVRFVLNLFFFISSIFFFSCYALNSNAFFSLFGLIWSPKWDYENLAKWTWIWYNEYIYWTRCNFDLFWFTSLVVLEDRNMICKTCLTPLHLTCFWLRHVHRIFIATY